MRTFRLNFNKGDYPGDQAMEWWTQEDYDKHAAYVEELKRTGEYGKPDYVDITYEPTDLKAFGVTEEYKLQDCFTNFGLLIPQGMNDKTPDNANEK